MTNLEWLMQDKERARNVICIREDICTHIRLGKTYDTYGCAHKECGVCTSAWLDAEHEEPDTQEKIDADAVKSPCQYSKYTWCEGCVKNPSQVYVCYSQMLTTMLRRQRELDARK